ncbi:MAG TPA: hypothetical protein PKI62_13185 [bacterium]|nr:hypothetical protein [bacterium]HPR89097.1 hypothetical protein [bacterium]
MLLRDDGIIINYSKLMNNEKPVLVLLFQVLGTPFAQAGEESDVSSAGSSEGNRRAKKL